MNPIPKSMKAVCLAGIGDANLRLCEVPVPKPGQGQILCRVEAATACASDTKLVDQGGTHNLMYGWDVEKFPVIIGHEASLTVAVCGSGIPGDMYREGMRCALQPAVPSGPQHDKERYRNNAEGIDKVAVGYTMGGTFAEYILLTEEVISTGCLVPLPSNDIPHFAVCLAEPYSCVAAAQERNVHFYDTEPGKPRRVRAGIRKGGITIVMGAGPMGMMHAEFALAGRAKVVIVSEPMEKRRSQVEKRLSECARSNSCKLIPTDPCNLEKLLNEISEGRGADDIIVAVGIAKLQEYALGLLAKGGIANFFGGTKTGAGKITVDTRRIHYDSISMVGSSGSDISHVAGVLDLIAEDKIDAGSYISAVGGMNAALDLLTEVRHQRFEGKGIVYPHQSGRLCMVAKWGKEEEAKFLGKT